MYGLALLLLMGGAVAVAVPAVLILWLQAWFIRRDARRAAKGNAEARDFLWGLADASQARLHDATSYAAVILLCSTAGALLHGWEWIGWQVVLWLLAAASVLLGLCIFRMSMTGDADNRSALRVSEAAVVVRQLVPAPSEPTAELAPASDAPAVPTLEAPSTPVA